MNVKPRIVSAPHYQYLVVPPSRVLPTLLEEVTTGLFSTPRELPCKYFYDAVGSDLFDQICETEEYYPTRTEAALLREHAPVIVDYIKPKHIIEFGSGTSRKTRYLFDAAFKQHLKLQYWPFDVCGPILEATAKELLQDYDNLQITILEGDYLAGFDHFPEVKSDQRLFIFLGGTIGNFQPAQALSFLRELRQLMRPGDHILIGFDRVKNKQVLEAAYNDSAGITAEFNLNILKVINRELGTDFNTEHFRHEARYDSEAQQIEMHLIARQSIQVEVPVLDNRVLRLDRDEHILTEISRKFTTTSIQSLLEGSGYKLDQHYEAPNAYYSLVLACVV